MRRVVTGPHNIVRRVVEFASSIRASMCTSAPRPRSSRTMIAVGETDLDSSELLFCDDLRASRCGSVRPRRPTPASSPRSRTSSAWRLRAHRPPRPRRGARPLRARAGARRRARNARRRQQPARTSTATAGGSRSTTPTSPAFSAELEAAFDSLAERYYLHLKCEPGSPSGRTTSGCASRSRRRTDALGGVTVYLTCTFQRHS